jgi:hypothetical protein
MKGDISADFHAPDKRYSGVRAQSGRVLTEADFNAAFDVLDNTVETLVRTLLCAAGSPDSGLQVLSATPVTLAAPDGTAIDTYEFQVAPGTFVLGGRATLLNSATWSVDQSDWLSQILTPDVLPPAPAARTDLVWVEQIEGAVRAVEDRELQERALPSDTTTRLRPQIKLRVLEDVSPDCHVAALTLNQTLSAGGHALSDDRSEVLSAARLGLAFVDDGPAFDPCAPGGVRGYLGAENHTLKVMLTAPDRFVWAYDHGEPLYRVQVDAANGQIEFLTEPRDPMLYPLPGQVIEILPWDVLLPNSEKAAAPLGHLARLTGHYHPRLRTIDYDGSMPADWQVWLDALPAGWLGVDDDPPRYFYARIWQAPTAGAGPDEPVGAGLTLPETGVALHFSGTGIAGDYWTAALRPNAPEIVHPWHLMIDPDAGDVPVAPPIGPRRFHAPLALITWPANQGAPVIEDCRNRFRRLCRIKSCCTYQVGDGHSSFGDFNSIQEAVEALPLEGGEICLLPGTHTGAIDLRTLRDIKISGCGFRTRIEIEADPADPDRPGVWLDAARGIRFSDFAISAAGRAVFGGNRCSDTAFTRLRIMAEASAGIALSRGSYLTVDTCQIGTEALPSALEAADLAELRPLVYLDGDHLTVEHSTISATLKSFNRNRVAMGGIQIGGRSRHVRIEDNEIEGGNGHGITLGSLIGIETQGNGGRTLVFPPWHTIDEDGCLKLYPGGTIEVPGTPGSTRYRSAGPISDLRIRDNLISRHGGCGISVAHWFIARRRSAPGGVIGGPTAAPVAAAAPAPLNRDDAFMAELDRYSGLDDIELEDVMIDDNRILRCMQINLASNLPTEAAFNSGYGGITLASAVDTTIDNNEIRGCGGTGRSPICGIYIRYAERLQINGNRISENGRPASLTNPLLVGNIGGIVLSHVDGVEEGLGTQLREVCAAMISHNTVVCAEGRALELVGSGQMLVQGNTLTSHGNNIGGVLLMLFFSLLQNKGAVGETLTSDQLEGQFRAAVSQIGGSAVLIVNTGVNRNIALWGASASAFLGKGAVPKASAPTEAVAETEESLLRTGGTAAEMQPGSDMHMLKPHEASPLAEIGAVNRDRQRMLPRGPVSFSDNMVTFDALSEAITLSLSSVAILSFDDVGMHDNHCAMDLRADFVLIDALVFGLASCRVVGNRFREILLPPRNQLAFPIPTTLFSAMTVGILNATELNQGTYCFLDLGLKKPQVVMSGSVENPRARLDTNRHMIPDAFCARFRNDD